MARNPTIGMFAGDAEIERRKQARKDQPVAPPRIWMNPYHVGLYAQQEHMRDPCDTVEYVRADLVATTATVDDEVRARKIVEASYHNEKGEHVGFLESRAVELIATALAQSRADAIAKVEAKRNEWQKGN